MIILDTHAWVWWASGSGKLSAKARRAIDQAEQLGVSAISCWEVAMLVEHGRLTLDRPVLSWLRQALQLPKIELVALTPDVAVEAAALDGKLHGDPADRIIVATAVRCAATLVSRDERIRRAGLIATLW
ncbi:MAG: type II toxin-antitoxin system VapC family toxin [Myxococcales bacterium]|nr:type II toxin-antitoxin system VapC family toxin [Myxococcales bacterium]